MRDSSQNLGNISNSEDFDTLWTKFKGKIHELMEKYIPQKQPRVNKVHKPWIDKHVKALQRKRNKLFKRQRATHRAKDISHFRQMKAKVQRAERHAYWKHVENIINLGDPESDHRISKQKRFWSYIKSPRKDSCGVAPLEENGKMHADSQQDKHPEPTIWVSLHPWRYVKCSQAIWQAIQSHGGNHCDWRRSKAASPEAQPTQS